MQAYKNRTINLDKPVKVYFNLHLKCFSLKQAGLVVAHAESVCLQDVTFDVNENGRQQVLREQRKNVHATVSGLLVASVKGCDTPVTYNPYKYNSFVTKENELPVYAASAAYLVGRQMSISQ